MNVPVIWAVYFTYQKGWTGIAPGDCRPERWVCTFCGQKLVPNPAGANAHLARHAREKERGAALKAR